MKWKKAEWEKLAAYLAGEMTAAEEIEYREQVLHKRETEEIGDMERQWKNMGNEAENSADTALAWGKLHQRLESDGLLEQASKERRIFAAPLLRIAASILLIVGLGIPAYYLLSDPKAGSQVEQMAEEGTRTVDLPDGSRVFLNQGAKISYPGDFRENRSLDLEGEAFFEVMSDPVNPFTVRSGKVTVSVLGTSFNVKQEASSGMVEVFVESGKVRMSLEDQEDFITLVPGDLGQSTARDLLTLKLPDPNYLSWKSKDFIFVEAQVAEVLRTLEKAYHVDIHSDPGLLDDKLITSTYREQSIESILETIATAFGYQVRKQDKQYYLEP